MSNAIERPVPWARFREENAEVFAAKTTPAWLQRNAEENGLAASGALVKRSGRWYVFPNRFWRWFAGGRSAA